MKVLKKWFRPDDEPSAGTQASGEVSEVPANHDGDASYDWRSLESTSSSIFDSPDTHRVRILKSERVRPANDDDNPGYDPYDTGSFDTSDES